MLSNFVSKRKMKESEQGSSLTSKHKKIASDYSPVLQHMANDSRPRQRTVDPDYNRKKTVNFNSQRKIKRPHFTPWQTKMVTDLGPTGDIDALLEEIDLSNIENKKGKHGGSKANEKSRKAKKSDKVRYKTNDEDFLSDETKLGSLGEFRYIQSDEGSFTEDTKQSNVNEFQDFTIDSEGSSSEASEQTKHSTANENRYFTSDDEGSFSEEATQTASDKFRYSTSDEGSSSEETKQRTSMFLV